MLCVTVKETCTNLTICLVELRKPTYWIIVVILMITKPSLQTVHHVGKIDSIGMTLLPLLRRFNPAEPVVEKSVIL